MISSSTNSKASSRWLPLASLLFALLLIDGGCSSTAHPLQSRYADPLVGTSPDEAGPASNSATGNALLPQQTPIRLSGDDEARIAQAVREARSQLLNANALEAVQVLSDAQFIRGWAQSVHGPDILFWLGHAHEQLDEPVAAMNAYRRMAALFPEAPLTRRARSRMRELESEIR